MASNDFSFAWNDAHSHGDGTFNIGTPDLLYLGETNLQTYLDGKLPTASSNGWEVGSHAGLVSTNAPVWLAQTNYAASITLTNDLERPLYLYATGAVSVAFSGLRAPSPVYLIVKGPDSLTFPAGTHFVGGAAYQTNMANHFVVWQYGTNLFCNPVTTSED